MRRELLEMKRCITEFQSTYGPFLQDQLNRSMFRRKLYQELLSGTAKSAVWATMIVVGSLLVSGIKDTVKRWLP